MQRAIRITSTVAPVYVVLGALIDELSDHIASLEVSIVSNPDFTEGMGRSLAQGVKAVVRDHPDCKRLLVLLVDQPWISPELLRAYLPGEAGSSTIFATDYGGKFGVPASFPAALFPRLLTLGGDAGARHILRDHPDIVGIVPPMEPFDLDTPEDYNKYYHDE